VLCAAVRRFDKSTLIVLDETWVAPGPNDASTSCSPNTISSTASIVMTTSPRQTCAAMWYCALPGLRVGFGGGAVADSDRMTCIDEVDGHALAHLAQADESDVHGFHHAAVSSALPAAQ
jgi:hypothetical protein